MVTDPYHVLGVSPGSGPDEIKQAYKRKVKQYHPDLHPNDKDAAQKMIEVNEAYDMLMHPERHRAKQQQTRPNEGGYGTGDSASGYSSGGGRQSNPYSQGGRYGWQPGSEWFDFEEMFGFGGAYTGGTTKPREEPGDTEEMRTAVRLINAGHFDQAVRLLETVRSMGRTARWHYLWALAQVGCGNTVTAQEAIRQAVRMDPENKVYRQLEQQYRMAGRTYENHAQGFDMNAVDLRSVCTGLCLANFCCTFCRCC